VLADDLPVDYIAKNRLTQYRGPASAYGAVLKSIDVDVGALLKTNHEHFTFSEVDDGFMEFRDFQTTGRGVPRESSGYRKGRYKQATLSRLSGQRCNRRASF
jgi:hypothetical protein